jgi:hypothetical protein
MLVIEKTRNGHPIVVVKRNWHPSRIGIALAVKPKHYVPRPSNIRYTTKETL